MASVASDVSVYASLTRNRDHGIDRFGFLFVPHKNIPH